MKKLFYLLLLFLVVNNTQAQPGFDKIYSFSPYPLYDVYSGIKSVLPDTLQILVAGSTYRDSTDNNVFSGSAAFLASYDYAGNVQWKKSLVFNPPMFKANDALTNDLLKKVRPGKYVYAGQGWDCTNVPNFCIPRLFLYFFKPNGDSIKFTPFPYDNLENINFVYSIMCDKQTNLIASGQYQNKTNGDTAGIWIVKFDSAGSFKWKKVIVDTPLYATGAKAFKAIEGNDNSYLFAGLGATPDTTYSAYAIWKTDTAGNVLWRKQLPRTPGWNNNEFYANDTYFDIIRASNGSGYYFMAACPKPVQYPGEPVGARIIYYCGKLNENGNIAWSKRYDRDSLHNEASYGLEQKANGDLLFTGKSAGIGSAENTPSSGASLFCTDSLGNVKWFKVTRRYNCPYEIGHILYSTKIAPNGNIVRGGSIGQFNKQPGCYDTAHAIAWLVMTDSMGRKNNTDTVTYPVTVDTIHVPVDTSSVDTGLVIRLIPDDEKPYLSLYPNPATDVIHLALRNYSALPSLLSVQVFDYTGKMILQKKLEHLEDTLDISAYPAGIYLIKLRYMDKDVGTGKFVKR